MTMLSQLAFLLRVNKKLLSRLNLAILYRSLQIRLSFITNIFFFGRFSPAYLECKLVNRVSLEKYKYNN